MSLDLGAPALEVAIGLSFVFFLLSLVVTSITELIARWTKKRAKTLETGIKGLLGDSKFAEDLFNHPLVQSDVNSSKGQKDPSYLSARNFALALVSLLKQKGAGDETLAKVRSGAAVEDEDTKVVNEAGGESWPLKTQLDTLFDEIGVKGDLDDFRKSAEKWFDDGMDRVSGWYTRWAQKITWIVAIVVAVGLNASALRIADRLIDEPTVRAAVVAGAQKTVDESDEAPKATGKAAQTAVDDLKTLQVPILWPKDNLPVKELSLKWETLAELLLTIAGWAITAFAISLGAPFWFDALGKLARLRSAGKKPEPEGSDPTPPQPQTLKLEVSQVSPTG